MSFIVNPYRFRTGGDPFFANVSLLLPLDSSAVDSSGFAHSVSNVGSPTFDTSNKQWGSASGSVTGGSGWSVPDHTAFEFGTGDFTLEMWVYAATFSGTQYLLNKWSPTRSWVVYLSGTTVYFDASDDGSGNVINASTSFALTNGAWNHIACVRNGNSWRAYTNGFGGTAVTSSISTHDNASPVLIGHGAANYSGLIDDVRITKGVARYTANYSPPSAAFPTF